MQPPAGPPSGEPPTHPEGFIPPIPPGKRHHWYRPRNIALGTCGAVAVIVAASLAAGGGSDNQSGSPREITTPAVAPVSDTPSPDTATPTPDVTVTRTDKQIVFKVWGSGQPSIQYGTDSDNNDGGGHLGILGEGNGLPWTSHMRFRDSALYYYVTAQLEGYGDIRCALVAKVTEHYSDGTSQTMQQTVTTGHASGGYNICTAESS